MKHLKSSSQDLRSLFETNITIEYVAESLKAVSAQEPVKKVLDWMKAQDFDVVGIETENRITGYVERSSLMSATYGQCRDYQRLFHPQAQVLNVKKEVIKIAQNMVNSGRSIKM
ncbi:hypothetical protein [Umezakia ovalisporum]|uniref:hypothetical protein n=1 Tax=Umezakia ovalisporum TaxID=75695 RepID=UPI0024730FE4|nr:hypothetical protein [Umezakia ovalisporum]MDH6087620.1 hypothetical protein [Umezakia ovalisporum Ak1311]